MVLGVTTTLVIKTALHTKHARRQDSETCRLSMSRGRGERDDGKEPPTNAGPGPATYVGAGALRMFTRGALTSQRQAARTATLRRNGCIQSYLRKKHVRETTLARDAHPIAVDRKIVTYK